jgi:hypothetical protein
VLAWVGREVQPVQALGASWGAQLVLVQVERMGQRR